eukprot:364630-Chlamydomonas_euryale.AAC.15
MEGCTQHMNEGLRKRMYAPARCFRGVGAQLPRVRTSPPAYAPLEYLLPPVACPTMVPTMPPSPSGPLANMRSLLKLFSSSTQPQLLQHENPLLSSVTSSTSAAQRVQ